MIALITFNEKPKINDTFKYERLGPMAMRNHRTYCSQHGYTFVGDTTIGNDRPACWAKIPAILKAFGTHEWVVWADSDTLVMDRSIALQSFCADDCDMIVQCPAETFSQLGFDPAEARTRMPLNTGVFLMRRSEWSKHFLRSAYDQNRFVSHGKRWNGIGEQEAMIHLLKQNPEHLKHIRYTKGLQCHPRAHEPGILFAHFYGNNGRYQLRVEECEEIIRRWEIAIQSGQELPSDIARFHWACIQNRSSDALIDRGKPYRFFYSRSDI